MNFHKNNENDVFFEGEKTVKVQYCDVGLTNNNNILKPPVFNILVRFELGGSSVKRITDQ